MTLARLLALLLVIAAVAPRGASAQASVPADFADAAIEAGLSLPTSIAFVPDSGALAGRRLLFVEQVTGRLRMLVDENLASIDPVGTVANVNTTGSERGLLGVAVDPRWPASPYVYMTYNCTEGGNFLRISRYALTGDLGFTGDGALSLDLASRHDLLTDVPDNAFNHNGGTLRFGPDSMLYASFGDDANSCAALDSVSLRGVILRLDVRGLPDGPGLASKAALAAAGNPFLDRPNANLRLVVALGLRNPFRFHVDPVTRELVVGDVGEGTWEELSLLDFGQSAGWPLFEGFVPFTSCAGRSASGHAQPVTVYSHSVGLSIIGMDVYRAPAGGAYAFPAEYEGDIFFSDYYTGFIRRLSWGGARMTESAMSSPIMFEWGGGVRQIADAIVGPDGAIWYCRQSNNFAANSGQIRAIRYTGPPVSVPGAVALALRLAAPAPNPATLSTRLTYSLPVAQSVRLEVLDLQGRSVRTLASGPHPAGSHTRTWDGTGSGGARVPPGLYLVRLATGSGVRTVSVSLMR